MNEDYEYILNQGLVKVTQKKYLESKQFFLNLIEKNKLRYEGYLNLSNILALEKKYNEAIDLLENYLNKIDSHQEIVNGLATHLFNNKDYKKLITHVNENLSKHDNHILNYLKGYCLNINNNNSEAEIFLKKSLRLNKNFWPSCELLLNIYDNRSMLSVMRGLIKNSKNHFSDNIKFKYFESLYLYRTSDYVGADKILNSKSFTNYIEKNENTNFLADCYGLLSKNNDKLLNHKQSLDYALKRNKILIGLDVNKDINKKDLIQTIETYTNFFDVKSNKFSVSKTRGLKHSNLTFLIGFPRSGTTLLDTILRSHSKTLVIEEKPYLLNIRHHFFKNHNLSELINLEEKNKIDLQEKYFNSFKFDPNKTIIDKFPLNLIELGFIKTIFPESKIILAIRHPLDSILSCVLTSFKINEAMLNFENLETTAFFYNKTFNLMIKYINFFEIYSHHIKYENVVLDFDNQIKNLLSYLNLEFEDSIKKFYETAKSREKIHTPSYDQVVKPLYSSSINRHLNFSNIGKIVPVVEKWIDFFGYKSPKY